MAGDCRLPENLRRAVALGAAALAGLAISALPWLGPELLPGNDLTGLAAVLLLGGFGPLVLLGWRGDGRDRLTSALAGLEPLPAERCPEVLAACQADPDCAAYRARATALGRHLTSAEADWLVAWAAGRPERLQQAELERQQQVACAILHSPEPLPPPA